jgi:serine protease Do
MSNVLEQLNTDMTSVVEGVQRALVHVQSGRSGSGAGTVWHPDGLIVTNAHVVRHGPLAVTLADGREFPARLLAQDSECDLAALTVDASGLPTIPLGDSHRLLPGEWVLALGHPWGVRGSVTAGTVIGVGAEWPELPRSDQEWVVVSLHLRPGYSGGPLVDVNGRLVGLNSMMTGPDVGVAVPVHVAKAFLREALGAPVAAA